MDTQGDAQLSPDECPPDTKWPLVAAGLTEGRAAELLLHHAAACDHCGPLLRQSVADFAEDLTAEEETMLALLDSSQPEWQARMAAKLGRSRRCSSICAWLRKHVLPRIT